MTDDILLTDKIVVIVGGVPEIAEAIARSLATRGAAGLMICGRGAERGQALSAIISAAGSSPFRSSSFDGAIAEYTTCSQVTCARSCAAFSDAL